MKVISGGGGIDADGNWYELPTVEREVPDDWREKMIAAWKQVPAPHQPSVMFISTEIYDVLKKS